MNWKPGLAALVMTTCTPHRVSPKMSKAYCVPLQKVETYGEVQEVQQLLVCDTDEDRTPDYLEVHEYVLYLGRTREIKNPDCLSNIYLRKDDPEPGCHLSSSEWSELQKMFNMAPK